MQEQRSIRARLRTAATLVATLALVGAGLSVASAASATTPAYEISGHVDVGAAGTSAARNQIEVQAYVQQNGALPKYENPTGFAFTDASGDYAMYNLPDATYYLKFSYQDVDGTYVYYQAKLDATASTPVTIADASLTDIDQLVPGLGTITGHVTVGADDHSAGAGVDVAVKDCAAPSSTRSPDGTDCGGLFGTPVQTDANGDFSISGLGWGQWDLQYSDSTHATYTTPASDWVEVDPDNLDVTVADRELLDLGSVTGHITLGDGSSQAGPGDVTVTLWGNSTAPVEAVSTDSSGNYNLAGVYAGTYKVTFHYKGTTGSYLDESTASVVVDRAPVPLDKTLPAAAMISGHVVDSAGNPMQDYGVTAVNVQDESDLHYYNVPYTPAQTTTDAHGDYTLRDLPSGSTEVSTEGGFVGIKLSHAQDLTLTTSSVISNLTFVVYATATITSTLSCSSCWKPNSSGLEEFYVLQWLNPEAGEWDGQPGGRGASAPGAWESFGGPLPMSSSDIPRVPDIPGTYRYSFFGYGQYSGAVTTAPFTVTENEVANLTFPVGKTTMLVRTGSKAIHSYTLKSTKAFGSATNVTLGANSTGAPKSLASLTWVGDAGDFLATGRDDLAGLSSTGQLWLYPRVSTTRFGAPTLLLGGLKGETVITPGDVNGDGWPDVLVKNAAGTLTLYPGNGQGGLATANASTLGAVGAWKSYNLIVGGMYTDGLGVDLLARSSSGAISDFAPQFDGTYADTATGASAKSAASILSVGSMVSTQGYDDILTVSSSGKLTLYPANLNDRAGKRKSVTMSPHISSGAKLL